MKEIRSDPEALLDMGARLQRLARELVADEPAAEDLVQEAWLAALQAPRDRVRDLGKWLRGVLRNRARGDRHREMVQRDHELWVARESWTESDAALIDRLSTAELLVKSVDRLEAPYGRVLRLRFLEERSVLETARAMDAPEGTVKVWTRRGLEKLRETLDRRTRGDRGLWSLALIRLSREGLSGGPARFVSRGASAWLALAGVLLCVAGIAWLVHRPPVDRAPPAADSLGAANEGQPSPVVALKESPGRDPLIAEVESLPAPEVPKISIAAHVVDENGWPVVGARVVAGNTRELDVGSALTDAEGLATLEVEARHAYKNPIFTNSGTIIDLSAFADGRARSARHYVAVSRLEMGTSVELRLGGRGYTFEGRILDEGGAPVESVLVISQVEAPDVRELEAGVWAQFRASRCSSDADGRFRFQHLARTTVRFQLRARGFLPRRFHVELGSEQELVEREIRAGRGRVLHGRLTLEDGSPAVGARIRVPYLVEPWGLEATTFSDETGRYELSGLPPASCIAFAAAKGDPDLAGHELLPAAGPREITWDAQLAPRAPLALQLVDADGEPEARRLAIFDGYGKEDAWTHMALSDIEGRVRIANPPDFPLSLAVMSRDYLTDGVSVFRVEGLTPSFEEQIFYLEGAELELGATLRARFPGPAGRGARLIAFSQENRFQRTVAAHPVSGEAELVRLAPGSYSLRAAFRGAGLLDLGTLELAAGEELDLGELIAPELVTLTLLPVTDPQNVDATAELVAVYSSGGRRPEVRVREIDVTRRTTLELLPGEFMLQFVRAHGPVRATFELWEGEPLELDLSAPLEAWSTW